MVNLGFKGIRQVALKIHEELKALMRISVLSSAPCSPGVLPAPATAAERSVPAPGPGRLPRLWGEAPDVCVTQALSSGCCS